MFAPATARPTAFAPLARRPEPGQTAGHRGTHALTSHVRTFFTAIKTDSADAAGAAAIVLAGEDVGDPKTADGHTEMLRVLRVARISAVRARAKAFNAPQRPHRHRAGQLA